MQDSISVKAIIKNYDIWKIKKNGLVVMTEKSISFMKREDIQRILDSDVVTIIEGTDYTTIVI